MAPSAAVARRREGGVVGRPLRTGSTNVWVRGPSGGRSWGLRKRQGRSWWGGGLEGGMRAQSQPSLNPTGLTTHPDPPKRLAPQTLARRFSLVWPHTRHASAPTSSRIHCVRAIFGVILVRYSSRGWGLGVYRGDGPGGLSAKAGWKKRSAQYGRRGGGAGASED